MLTIDQISQAVSKIGKKYGIKTAYLFGSYARGDANEHSDVDLIVDKGSMQKYGDYIDFKLELSRELNTDVDVLTTSGVRERFLNLIKKDQVLIYGA